ELEVDLARRQLGRAVLGRAGDAGVERGLELAQVFADRVVGDPLAPAARADLLGLVRVVARHVTIVDGFEGRQRGVVGAGLGRTLALAIPLLAALAVFGRGWGFIGGRRRGDASFRDAERARAADVEARFGAGAAL